MSDLFAAIEAAGVMPVIAIEDVAHAVPLPRFIPTGGVTEGTVGDWLRLPSVLAVGGDWIASTDDIRDGRWGEIAARARETRA